MVFRAFRPDLPNPLRGAPPGARVLVKTLAFAVLVVAFLLLFARTAHTRDAADAKGVPGDHGPSAPPTAARTDPSAGSSPFDPVTAASGSEWSACHPSLRNGSVASTRRSVESTHGARALR